MAFSKRSLLAALSAALIAACSSAPDIPDQNEQIDYRSTTEGEEGAAPKTEANENQEAEAPVTPVSNGVPKATGPVAIVNGNAIPADDFNVEIQRMVRTGLPQPLVAKYKDVIVQKLVDRYLIDQAVASSKIEVTDEETNAKLDEVKAEFARTMQASGQEVTLEALIAQLGVTEKELRESVQQSVAIEKILASRGLADPTNEEVRKFYDDNIEQLTVPEQVRVRHILVRVDGNADEATVNDAKKRAEALRGEALKKGVDFGDLAREKSEGPSAANGGDLGPVPRGKTVPEFEEAAFGLKEGEISAPVRSPFGWHIIKSEGKDEAKPMPFDEVSERIFAQMKGQRVKAELDELLAELREKADIQIKSENVN